jgi:Ala-tRNA(Pro) deacylase
VSRKSQGFTVDLGGEGDLYIIPKPLPRPLPQGEGYFDRGCVEGGTGFIGMDTSTFFAFLDEHAIAYQRCDHPAVYTVEEAARLVPPLPGAKTKNLFLRDKPGRRHFLVCVPAAKQVDLKLLSDVVGAARLSLGSAGRLRQHLGVEPGAVTLLAVFNDPAHGVDLFVDEDLWQADAFQFHPLVNTATLVLSREAVARFVELTGHRMHLVRVPEKK